MQDVEEEDEDEEYSSELGAGSSEEELSSDGDAEEGQPGKKPAAGMQGLRCWMASACVLHAEHLTLVETHQDAVTGPLCHDSRQGPLLQRDMCCMGGVVVAPAVLSL